MIIAIIIIYIIIIREVGDYKIVGCPKCIDDKKYKRNAFIFNFVFVFSCMDTSSYEPVIQKMGNSFKTYEVSTFRIISSSDTNSLLFVLYIHIIIFFATSWP